MWLVLKVEVQDHIGGDHTEIQHVEEHHIPVELSGHKFGSNAAQIADVHQDHKGQALALVGLVFQGGDDVVGPAAAEAKQHDDL